MTSPKQPVRSETPTFLSAMRKAPEVMRRLGVTHILVWVMYADDSIGLHRFNRNGSHRKVRIEDHY